MVLRLRQADPDEYETLMAVLSDADEGDDRIRTAMSIRSRTTYRATWNGVRCTAQRYSGLAKSNRQPASHSLRWLPCTGIPPASLSMRARCSRFQVMNVVLRLVKSLSGPPEPGSR